MIQSETIKRSDGTDERPCFVCDQLDHTEFVCDNLYCNRKEGSICKGCLEERDGDQYDGKKKYYCCDECIEEVCAHYYDRVHPSIHKRHVSCELVTSD